MAEYYDRQAQGSGANDLTTDGSLVRRPPPDGPASAAELAFPLPASEAKTLDRSGIPAYIALTRSMI